MKKIFVLMLSLMLTFVLVGCGSGITQEEYDKIVSENELLQKEYDFLKKSVSLNVKTSEYKAKVEEQNKHALFVLKVIGKATNTDTKEQEKEITELHKQVSNAINLAEGVCNMVSISEYDIDLYEETEKSIDEMYDSWEKTMEAINSIEEMMLE